MSYAQGIEVILHPVLPSAAALATHYGPDLSLAATTPIAKWAPGYFSHKVHAIGVVMTAIPAALAANTPLAFHHYRPWTGTDSATRVVTINLPTTLSLASGPRGVIGRVTSNVEILPGEALVLQPTTAPTAGLRALCVAYVSPNYEQPTTVRTASTASTAGGEVVFVNTT